jgi:hypothetical protein
MAKGQQRQPKEKKKPKADTKTKHVSGYKAQYGGSSSMSNTPMHNMNPGGQKKG